MLSSLLLLVVGTVLVLWGADRLTDSACTIARRFGISEMVIGLTIVSMGTSLPEFVISMSSVVAGSSAISVGNIVGSNLFNVLVIVGLSAVVAPIAVAKSTITKDIPFALLASVVFMLLSYDGVFSRTDGLTLLCFFVVFMWYTFCVSGNGVGSVQAGVKQAPLWRSVLIGVLGLAALVYGGDLFVDAATEIALGLGVSEMMVGLTIVAAGTSLPELATSIVAARKGASELAIGNVIGSNMFNVFFVLGLSSSMMPTTVLGLTAVEQVLLILSVLMMWLFATTNRNIGRREGVILTLTYVAYSVVLYNLNTKC